MSDTTHLRPSLLAGRHVRVADGVPVGGEGEVDAAGGGQAVPHPVARVDLHEAVAAVARVALELDLADAVVAELVQQAQACLGELGHPQAHGHAHVAEARGVLAQLVPGELRQRSRLGVQVRPQGVQLLVAAGHDVLQHQRAAVAHLVVDAQQLVARGDLEHVPAKAGLEGQRLDGLEDAREADLVGAAREVVVAVDEHGLRRVHADAPRGLDLLALVVQTLHRLPAGERDEVPGLQALGVPGDGPDVLVVGREEHGALRQAAAELLEEGDEGLLVLARVGAHHPGGEPRVQAQGARVGVDGEQRHVGGGEVADDVEPVGPGDLQHDRRVTLLARP